MHVSRLRAIADGCTRLRAARPRIVHPGARQGRRPETFCSHTRVAAIGRRPAWRILTTMTTDTFPDLDHVDRAILDCLVRDARTSISAVAERVHVSRANAYARVQRMVETGVVEGFTVRVPPAAVGLGASAYIGLNIAQDSWREVREALGRVEGVDHIALCSGDVDVVVLARTPDIASLRDLVLEGIRSIPGVETTRTSIILDELGNTGLPGQAPAAADPHEG